ncbi:DUF3048 domain-containing protein [Cryobacterium frigoriphilum]|uniref:DUF3048 domain-containing protein n=1 Tax=Cryobacterium frigoriphilum TaxID=1259150 RepID=A0A4R8ZXG1_9MICO|nr:DUF3048 domain-containing protein [Cryobacterium frigoriphilum]TFD48352.1 DUF3048 domain-containing protein [Cryobacterium frigoriphilum]
MKKFVTSRRPARSAWSCRPAWIAAVIVPAVLLTGCTGDSPVSTDSPTKPSSTWDSRYVAPEATKLSALRGVTVPAGSLMNPALSVKIDNHEAARPQIGLERADIVFEELVEGGLTRYLGVWQSDIPDTLGPVRSIRPMDPDIMTPFGGIAAYSGGQQQFLDMMNATPLLSVIFDYDTSGLFSRTGDKSAPHNVILQSASVVAAHTDLAPPAQQFAYAPTVAASSAVIDGTPINAINTRFSNARFPSWAWNGEAQSYLRSQEGAADFDSNGTQLRATNVVVMRVDIDDSFGEVPKTTMVGSGDASVSTGGKSIHATWSKASQADPIRLVDDNGVTIRLGPGNTWIELVPNGRGSFELVP